MDRPKEMTIDGLPGGVTIELNVELEGGQVLKIAFGPVIYEAFTRAKWEEWDDYRLHVTDYEVERYLETA